MNKLLALVVLFAVSFSAFAHRNCGTMDHLDWQQSQDPELKNRMEKIEAQTRKLIQNQSQNSRSVITIPTVVHIVYRTTSENISDAQVLSQISVLNQDFRRLNADASQTLSQFVGVAADSEIEFCLASVDPNGNPTSGITRTQTTVSAHGTNNSVKFNSQGGKDAWPTGSYLNIWVCNIGGGILGYAQFPGGNASTDGTVVDYRYFGTIGTATAPFNKGRTATHEVGHWLNLRHIWGDGGCSVDDGVSDTPLAGAPNYGCPLSNVSCSTLDMVQNYMDYTDDACMNLFTAGQKSRMRALFQPGGFRYSLLSSNGCGSSAPTCNDGIQNGNETGIDCGGPDCPPCPPPSGCLTYCTSQGNSTVDEYIQQVTIGSYTNTSGNNGGYAFFNTTASFEKGQTYSINLRPAWTGTVYPEYFRIWADWNQNGSFGDAGELAFDQGSASTASQVTGTITIPSGAGTGKTTFRVQMKYNAAPTSCESFTWGEVENYCVEITNPAPTCSVPVGLNATGITSSQATLNWNSVTGATSYNVRARAIGASTWSTGTVTGTSVNYTGLTACNNYEFQVEAVCSGLASGYSVSSTFTTTGCTPVCTVPSGLGVSGVTSSQATLNWSAVSGATSYTVRAKAMSASTWASGSTTGTSINFTGLSSCTGYEFQVEAVCNGATSGFSSSFIFTSGGCTCNSPVTFWMTNVQSTSATFNWNPMPSATNYTFRFRRSGTNSWTSVNTTATSITRTGLLCGTAYQWQVRARCGNTWRAYSATQTFSTLACNREQLFEGEEPKLAIQLYPNPANRFVKIETSELLPGKELVVNIFDLKGSLVLRYVQDGHSGVNSLVIQTEELPEGTYFVQLNDGSRVATKKLMILK